MKILAVDDDPVIRDLLQVILAEDGQHVVTFAESGWAALDHITRSDEAFDVLLLDIEMPGMDGVTLCHKVRVLPSYVHTPIVMLTAKSDVDSIESAFSAGANDYITKPFDIKSIVTKIEIARRMLQEVPRLGHLTQPGSSAAPAGVHAFAPEDQLRLCGVDQHTDAFSLGNYLFTMERHRIAETSVFAAQLLPFQQIYEEGRTDTVLMALTEAWKGITASINNRRLLGAYLGAGTFICISENCVQELWYKHEPHIDRLLRSSDPWCAVAPSPEPAIALSRPFRPNASKTKRVKPTFDRALWLLDKRLEAEDAGENVHQHAGHL